MVSQLRKAACWSDIPKGALQYILGWWNLMDKCHWGWRPAERPQTERCTCCSDTFMDLTKKTNPSPENCQNLSLLPFTLCNLSLSFSTWCYQERDPNLAFLFYFSMCFLCMIPVWCSVSPPYSEAPAPLVRVAPKLLPAPGLLSNRPGETSFNSQSTAPVISEEGKEGKASSCVTCPCRTPISSPQLDLQLNTNRQSGSKSWGKGGDPCQSAFNLISAKSPTGSLGKLTVVLLTRQISF